jgi:hypothetical protein
MEGRVAAFSQDLSCGDTSKVTDMKGSVAAFNQDLSSEDTSKVTDGILLESSASSRLCAT